MREKKKGGGGGSPTHRDRATSVVLYNRQVKRKESERNTFFIISKI